MAMEQIGNAFFRLFVVIDGGREEGFFEQSVN